MKLGRALRWWVYFRRGYSVYLVFAVGFLNFVVIQYRLLVQHIPLLHVLFPSITSFAAVTTVFLVVLGAVLGWVDYKKASVRVETALTSEVNPFARDLAYVLLRMVEHSSDLPEEVKRDLISVLRRWSR